MNSILKRTALSAGIIPAAAIASAQGTPREDDRPNIVVIVADDLLTTELSCYGGQNLVTPNIDRLAREGVKFTRNYASEAMSVPIRASMYTGLYPARHGSYQNHRGTFPGTFTVNEYMAEEGYRVGRTGKDHPGPKSVYKFDEIPGFTVGCTAKKAPYSCDGIREWMTHSDDPFLLYVCSINTHAPWTWGDPSEFDADKVILPENCAKGPEMREIFTHYLAEVRALDNEVGSVLETLEETGRLDNTIVIFLGEQGPQFPGGKWTLWYPGCHSALIARYPARIKAGRICNAIVQYEDLLPTFIDIAGGDVRPELDGISFKDALFGDSRTARKYAYGIHNNYPEGRPYPIRSIRDDRYCLIMNLMPEEQYHEKHLMMENRRSVTGVWEAWEAASGRGDEESIFWKDRFLNRPAIEFYDLKKDPWERKNLAGVKRYAKKIEEMKKELFKWMEEQGDTGIGMDGTNPDKTQKDR
ncbi:MAG: sulfatase [Bacteroides sp.]|nr:sulfatase [Bacteroides sp.]